MSLRWCLLLALAGALAGPPVVSAQAAVADRDVSEGIRLVEMGDYDAAILTLDNAARRLAADPAQVRDLSQAYLYLGIAYMGKGHEAAARAKFRDAITQMKDMTLSPEKYPPKVIDLFESVREESAKAPVPAATAAAATPPVKKGGSKTPFILIGLGGAAAAGVAVAAGSGGGGDGSQPAAVTPTTAPVAPSPEDISGFLPATEGSRRFPIIVRSPGALQAELSWVRLQPPGAAFELVMQLFDGAGRDVALSNRTAETAAVLRANVTPQEYSLSVFYGQNQCPGCEAQFHLLVNHP